MWMLDQYNRFKYWYVTIYKHAYKVDLGLQVKLPFFTKLKYNLIGFTDEDYYNFDLTNNDYHSYICYKERLRLENINGHNAFALGEKVMFERLFGDYVRVPHIYGWIHNGNLIDLENGEKRDAVHLIKSIKKIIAKPANSVGGGTGIVLLEYKDASFYINQERNTVKEYMDFLKNHENYILVSFIESAKYSRDIYPKTANSIRVVSVINSENEVEFLFAFHRFGSNTSFPVDNISSGGIVALIDLQNGKMGVAKAKTAPQTDLVSHPDTGGHIKDVQIPGWKSILKELEHAHKCFPYFQFMAWDVVIDQDDKAWVLEINRGTDLGIQMIQPMRHEKLGQYMRKMGLLNNW